MVLNLAYAFKLIFTPQILFYETYFPSFCALLRTCFFWIWAGAPTKKVMYQTCGFLKTVFLMR